MSNTPSFQLTDQDNPRRKRWKIIFIAVCVQVLLCVLAFCIFGVIGVVDRNKPKTNLQFYQDASIAHMLESCDPQRHFSWEDWMTPVSGHDRVLALNYSKSAPVPDALYAYTLFIQIDPMLLETGQEFSLTGEGVQPFLLETRAPFMVCSGDLTGTISVLEGSDSSVRARLDVTGVIYGGNWEYHGEVVFKQAPLPK